MLDLRVWPNVVADGHTPTKTPGKGHDKNDPSTYEMWKLDNLTERYRNGHIPKVWGTWSKTIMMIVGNEFRLTGWTG